MYHLSDAVRVRTFCGLQSVDCGKLRVFRRTGVAAQCGGITGSVLLARVVYLLFFKEGGEK